MDEKRPFSGYFEVPHTADIAIEVLADSLVNLFVNAAKGLYHILGIQTGTGIRNSIRLEMEEMDVESLLVLFLNELLFHIEANQAAAKFNLEIRSSKLLGNLEMENVDSWTREIKAVTYSELKIRKTDQGFRTKIVFDI